MASLNIYDENGALLSVVDNNDIARVLTEIGVDYCYCQTINFNSLANDVLDVYKDIITELQERCGYQSYDVVVVTPNNFDVSLRAKFASEHIHLDDEVRFFVEGGGKFCVHVDDKIYAIACTAGDFLSVPANVKHWFDVGDLPYFTAIRLFKSTEGWVPKYTGKVFDL